jgi:tRNA (cytidine/uridine-2'-O-)-methyltransferase
VFGKETTGLSPEVVESLREGWVSLPMPNRRARSMNLSNCVAVVVYEALRQLGFPDVTPGIGSVEESGIEPA